MVVVVHCTRNMRRLSKSESKRHLKNLNVRIESNDQKRSIEG